QGQYLGTLRALASAVANKDPVTLGHSVRVGQLAAMLGRHFQLDERTIAQLEMGGYLHDLGKIGIRDSVRLKLEALTPQQRNLLEHHPHLDLLASANEGTRVPLDSLRKPASYSAAFNEQGTIVARIVEAADLYDAVGVGSAVLEASVSSRVPVDYSADQVALKIPRLSPEIIDAIRRDRDASGSDSGTPGGPTSQTPPPGSVPMPGPSGGATPPPNAG